jgi:PAS domain S-box-containing protein
MRQMLTEHSRMEEALRLSEERFSKAFNASPSTMAITSLNDGRFIDANDNFCKVVGYAREEIIGKTSLEVVFWLECQNRL